MNKFIVISGKIFVVLCILIVLVIIFREFASTTRPRRQPLQIEISETDSPFSVSDRHDETRNWIDGRISQD